MIAAQANQTTGSYDTFIDNKFTQYKTKEGPNNLRFMPPTFDYAALKVQNHWGLEIYVHYGVGPDEATYLCPNKMRGEPCVVCDTRREIAPTDPEAAKELREAKRYLIWTIDRFDPAAGPKVFVEPPKTDKEFCNRAKGKKTGETLMLDDPENGYDVTFVKEGTGVKSQYSQYDISRHPSALSDNPDEAAKWLDFIVANPLDTTLVWFDQEYIAKVLAGGSAKPDTLDPDAAAQPGVAEQAEAEAAAEAEAEPTAEEVLGEEAPADDDALTPDFIRQLGSWEDLGEVATVNSIELVPENYATFDEAVESLILALWPDGEPVAEEAPLEPEPPPPPARRAPAPARAAAPPARAAAPAAKTAAPARPAPVAKTAAGASPVEQAKARVAAALAKRGK